jgi:hypothetical protein
MTLQLSARRGLAASQASWFVSSGDAEFGISESGELVCVGVRRPDVTLPPDYPG